MKGTYLKAKGGSVRVLTAVTATVLSLGLSGLALTAAGPAPAQAATSTVSVYRLYNKHSGEHFYTARAGERDHLRAVGWNYEGVGWTATSTGAPVYRIYNPNARWGDHYYTMSYGEAAADVRLGWRWDNNQQPVFYSPTAGARIPVTVAYNPQQYANNHNYTENPAEQSNLVGLGWRDDGTAWYAVEPPYWGDSKPKALTQFEDSREYDRYPDVISYSGNVVPSDTVFGQSLDDGFGGSIQSNSVTLVLGGKYQNFSGKFFNCDSSDAQSRLRLTISDPVSLRTLWTSGTLIVGQSQDFSVNISGHSQLRLTVDQLDTARKPAYAGIYNGIFR